ncbi:MAG TPA: zf-HC2 domain-containing protein [Pseudonocardiaceae bacterium]|nr:zf-HC2 domain-containing protein [Pseudonocardiaceae bacterium]
MTCAHRIDVAAYLLDALEDIESAGMRAHLETCPDCTLEYDELSGLPGLLGALTPNDVENILAPAELPDSLCEQLISRAASRRHRRNRHRLLAVGVILVGSVVAGATIASRQPAPPSSVTVSATDATTHVHANVTMTAATWGTALQLRLTGVTWAQRCELVVHGTQGQQDVAASWVANYQGSLDITGSTAIAAADIRQLAVVTDDGRLLVALPGRQ